MYARVHLPSKVYIPNDLFHFFNSGCESLLSILHKQFNTHDLLDQEQMNRTYTKVLKIQGKLSDLNMREEMKSVDETPQDEKD